MVDAFYNCTGLTSVYNYADTPQSLCSYDDFSNAENCILYVPYGCKPIYEAAEYWKEFKEVKEMEPSAIENVNTSPSTAISAQYYQISGTQSNGLKQGLNIIKTQDGVKKVLVK